jgi:hypothetical protein
MAEQIGGVLDNEQTEAEAIGAGVTGSLKGLKNHRQSSGADADAGVADLDAQFPAAPASGDEHAAAGPRVVDRVAYRVAQHADATAILRPVYDRFTEGFATADLNAAKALLGTLR